MTMYLMLFLMGLPVLAGVLLHPLHLRGAARKAWCIVTAFLEAAGTLLLLFQPESSFTVLSMTDTLTIAFRLDLTAKIFAAIAGFAWLPVAVFAFPYLEHEGGEDFFFSFYLIVEGMLFGMDFSSNLVTLYLFFELVTLTSMPLVLHSLEKESIAAALKYLFYSVGGAFLALFGIFILARYTDSLEFAAGGCLDLSAVRGHETLLLTAVFLAVVGFGAKAGLYPLHGWLPTAHPVAPAPASAVLSGIIAKAGVLAIFRLIYFSVGTSFLAGTWVQYAWLGLSLLTVFMGSMMAYREQVFKKRLAYSTVSQVSYVLTGLFLFQEKAVAGALLHVLFHATIKVCLFLSAGAVIRVTGKTRVEQLRGLGKAMPVTFWGYTLASLALIGIPPFSGFVSKWYLAEGALASGVPVYAWLAPVILLVSALLTAGYLLPITISGFFPGEGFPAQERNEGPASLWLPVIILGTATLLLGVFSAPIARVIMTLAESLV